MMKEKSGREMKAGPEWSYYLSELLGANVLVDGQKAGKLADIVINDGDVRAEVTHFVVSRSFGKPSLLVPWERVRSISPTEIFVDAENPEQLEGSPAEGTVLLKDHLLDKKVLDMVGKEAELVCDVRLVVSGCRMYVTAVDFSGYGLMRRMGLRRVARLIRRFNPKFTSKLIPWKYVQALPKEIDSFKGELRLKVLKESLAGMHPADLADLIEELDPHQRVMVFNELSSEHASDTLEEVSPSVQRSLVSAMKKEKVARLVADMTPGQAADLLSALPWWDVQGIMKRLDKVAAEKIRHILDKQRQRIINFASHKFLKVSPDATAGQLKGDYSRMARNKDIVMYLYVTDRRGVLLGVVDVKELFGAKDKARVSEIMTRNPISLKPKSRLKQASEIFSRYDFRALPVVDDDGKIVGAVPYVDVMKLKHTFMG